MIAKLAAILIAATGLASVPLWAHSSVDTEQHVTISLSGGDETNPVDHGRPVILIASAIGVNESVFREAFSHVTPARGGPPEPEQVRKNKAALLEALGPYGITNERLDEVSDYYRYNASRGEVWKRKPAAGYAIVSNGEVTGFTVTDGGGGYSSEPKVTVPGYPDLKIKVTVKYGQKFETNGSVSQISLRD